MNAKEDRLGKKPDRLDIAIDLFIDFLMENNLSGVEENSLNHKAHIDNTKPLTLNEPITQSQRSN